MLSVPPANDPSHRRHYVHTQGTANYFCIARIAATTAFTSSADKPLALKAWVAFLLGPPLAMKSVRSASDFFLASSDTRLGIFAAGLPVASAPWHAAHLVL